MGTTAPIQDISGYTNIVAKDVAAVASNGADTLYQPICRAQYDGAVRAVYWTVSASQNTDATNYRTLKLVNLGSAAAGTVVIASLALSATKAANIPHALTLGSVVTVSAGDLLVYVTTSTGSGVAVNAAVVQVQLR